MFYFILVMFERGLNYIAMMPSIKEGIRLEAGILKIDASKMPCLDPSMVD